MSDQAPEPVAWVQCAAEHDVGGIDTGTLGWGPQKPDDDDSGYMWRALYLAPPPESAIRASERERCLHELQALHMAQTVNNQNRSNDWHEAIDDAIATLRELGDDT
jgi:hypothetical protein